MADITAPAYRTIPIVPALKPGAMAGKGPFIASDKHQEALGFPGQLVDDWHDKAIAKMGDLLGKFRSLRVFLDACVHCGACTLNRREVLYRQREARAAGIPMTNYGLVLAHVHGILDRALAPFPAAKLLWDQGTEALTARRQEL